MLKSPHSKRARVGRTLTDFAKRLEGGAFTANFSPDVNESGLGSGVQDTHGFGKFYQ